MLNISTELKCEDIKQISKLLGVTIGTVDSGGYKPSSIKGRAIKTSSRIYVPKKRNIFKRLKYDAFKNEVVVFTGKLDSMLRDEAVRLVRRLGGTTGSFVTKKTTILVTNMKYIKNLRREEMGNKFKKAVDLNAKGQNIKFLNEEEFLGIK